MLELSLSIVTAAHFWVNGENVLLQVCNYYSEHKVSKWYYFYPYRKVVEYNEPCPQVVLVPKR